MNIEVGQVYYDEVEDETFTILAINDDVATVRIDKGDKSHTYDHRLHIYADHDIGLIPLLEKYFTLKEKDNDS